MKPARFTVEIPAEEHEQWLTYIDNSVLSSKRDLVRRAVKEYISPNDDWEETSVAEPKITPDDIDTLRREHRELKTLLHDALDAIPGNDELSEITRRSAYQAHYDYNNPELDFVSAEDMEASDE